MSDRILPRDVVERLQTLADANICEKPEDTDQRFFAQIMHERMGVGLTKNL